MKYQLNSDTEYIHLKKATKGQKTAARLSGNNLATSPYIQVLTHIDSISKCTAEVNEKHAFFKGFPPFLWLDLSINYGVWDMPYIIEIVKAGQTLEISKYYSSRYNKKGIGRGDRKKLTTEEQRKVNKRAAEKKLRRLINENFQEGDTHLVLDYKLSERPEGREGMRVDADDFLKEMRKLYKFLGIPFKYIHVMEIGKKGALHHHLVINTPEGVSQRAITKAWKGRGRTHFNPMDDTGQYAKLAAYLIKQSDGMLKDPDALQGKRWNSSKNLRKPTVIRKEPIKDRGWYNRVAKLPKKLADSYYLDGDSIQEGIHERTGYTFFSYTFVRINQTWKETEIEWEKL